MSDCPHGLTGEAAMWCLDCESEAVWARDKRPPTGVSQKPEPAPSRGPAPASPSLSAETAAITELAALMVERGKTPGVRNLAQRAAAEAARLSARVERLEEALRRLVTASRDLAPDCPFDANPDCVRCKEFWSAVDSAGALAGEGEERVGAAETKEGT